MIRNLLLCLLLVASTASAQLAPGVPVGGGGLSTIVTYYPTAGCEKSLGETISGWWTHNSASAAVVQCDNTGLGQRLNGRLSFSDVTNNILGLTTVLPADQSGAINIRLFWSTTATTGDVEWNVATVCMGNDDAYSPALNTAQQVVDTAGGTANDLMIVALNSITQTGCLAGEVMHFAVTRDGTDDQDTIAATAFLHGMEITITRG